MDRDAFEAALRRDGFTVVNGGQPPGHVFEPHAHDVDLRILVLGGHITLTRDGVAETFRPGEHCEIPAGCPHAEVVGPEGVAYILGRRAPA